MLRRFAVLVGLLLAASPAVAGPLPVWSYRTILETAPGQTELFLGRFQYQDRTDARDVYAYAGLPTAGAAGTAAGDTTITAAGVSKGGYRLADEPTPGADLDSFRVLLEITDATSGLRGFTYLGGRGRLVTSMPASLESEAELTGDGRVLMQLGGNRYDIRTRGAQSESNSLLVADVSVTSVNTPEPATLLLAGLGLGLVGVRRLRRK